MTTGSRYNRASRLGRRGRGKGKAKFFLALVFLLVIVFALVYVSRADFLKIKGIEVAGADGDLREKIVSEAKNFSEGALLGVIPRTNFLIFDGSGLASVLLTKYPRIKNIDVNKKADGRVEISLQEREAKFLWCDSIKQCFNMDMDGFIFEVAESFDSGMITFTGGISGDPLSKNFLPANEMIKFSKLIEGLSLVGLEVSVIDFHSADKIEVYTNMAKIILNPSEDDFSAAIENTSLILSDLRKKNPDAEIDYIDARFGSKVFYKTAN
jgi:hypothetical protein